MLVISKITKICKYMSQRVDCSVRELNPDLPKTNENMFRVSKLSWRQNQKGNLENAALIASIMGPVQPFNCFGRFMRKVVTPFCLVSTRMSFSAADDIFFLVLINLYFFAITLSFTQLSNQHRLSSD